jgi:choloylglycine hydrolase
MRQSSRLLTFLTLLMITTTTFFGTLDACTGIQLKARDGSVVYGRTLEFPSPLLSQVIFIPRNYGYQGVGPTGQKDGISWRTKYAIVGANGLGEDIILDGLNEKGLALGMFFFPGYAQYQNVLPSQAGQSLTCLQLSVWILSNCATINDVKTMLPNVMVNTSPYPAPKGQPEPVHYNIHDEMGNALVIEYVGGKLNVYDNPIGVLTNAPTFDWHTTNLNNYINLSPMNADTAVIDRDTFAPFGQGSGMLGLPGDYTPPSRFVRAVAYSKSTEPVNTAEDAVFRLFHILDNFDIPVGTVRGYNSRGALKEDYTLWTTANDLRNKRFYFHTEKSRIIRMVDLNHLNANSSKILYFSMDQPEQVVNLTNNPIN